jgi:dienelactone hydrolase
MTNEGFRQTMFELQSLVSWLLHMGHPQVAMMGMSLGGYTTALAATVEPRLSCAIPVIPLGSIADFARDQGRLGATPGETEREHSALDAVHRVVSPLHRAPLLAGDRMWIVAADADRITPVEHAHRLGRHFGTTVSTWHGGHLLQFGRRDQFRSIGRFLRRQGMTEPTAGKP